MKVSPLVQKVKVLFVDQSQLGKTMPIKHIFQFCPVQQDVEFSL